MRRQGGTLEQVAALVGCCERTVRLAMMNRPDYEGGTPEHKLRKSHDVPESAITRRVDRLLKEFNVLPKELAEMESQYRDEMTADAARESEGR